MSNFFAHHSIAARYAAARPDFYPLIIAKIQEFLGLEQPLIQALDVACGTGLSTRPLRTLAQQIIGADISAGMLAQAMEQPRPGNHSPLSSPGMCGIYSETAGGSQGSNSAFSRS